MNHFATLSFAQALREQSDSADQAREEQVDGPKQQARPRTAAIQRPYAVMAPRKG